MAPVERGLHGLVPGHRGTACARRTQSIVEALRQLAKAEEVDSGSRQLDGERDPLQAAADLDDTARVAVGELEVIRDRGGLFGKELDRAESECRRGRQVRLRRRQIERPEAMHPFAVDTEGFATGREDGHPARFIDERLRKAGCRLDDVLAIVEDDENLLVAEKGKDARKGAVGPGRQAQRRRQGVRDERGVLEGREVHEPEIAAIGFRQRLGDGDGKRRLADPRGTDDRQKALGRQPSGDGRHGLGPSDNPRVERRKIVTACGSRPGSPHGSFEPAHGHHEAVAAPRLGHDVSGALPALAENPSQLRKMHPKIALLDEGGWPDAGYEIVLRNQFAGAFHQGNEEIQRTDGERERLTALDENALRGEQSVRSEAPCELLLIAAFRDRRGLPFLLA